MTFAHQKTNSQKLNLLWEGEMSSEHIDLLKKLRETLPNTCLSDGETEKLLGIIPIKYLRQYTKERGNYEMKSLQSELSEMRKDLMEVYELLILDCHRTEFARQMMSKWSNKNEKI